MHVMIDLETLSTAPDAVIMQIAAVAFNIDGDGHDDFLSLNVSPQTCIDAGLTVEYSTIKWWMEQGRDVQRQLPGFDDKFPTTLREALGALNMFLAHAEPLEGVWAHGAPFDIPILESAYRALRLPTPIPFHRVRDTRTLYNIVDAIFNASPTDQELPKDTRHHALNDACQQVLDVQRHWKILTARKKWSDHGFAEFKGSFKEPQSYPDVGR